MEIVIYLSGPARIEQGGEKIRFATKKSEAIFYYLALQKHAAKAALELIFWPELSEDKANHNLRNAIYYINKAFGGELFQKSRGTLEFLPEVSVRTVYQPLQGELMEGFSLKDCPDFDLFLEEQRKAQALQQYDISRVQFMEQLNGWGQKEVMNQYITLFHMNPYDEETALAVMEYLFQKKQYDELIRIYKMLENVLREELMIEPLKEIQNLYRTALMEKKTGRRADQMSFFGRREELQKIELSYDNFLHMAPYSNFLIVGDIGCGKSSFLTYFLERHTLRGVRLASMICYEAERNIQYKVLYILAGKMLKAAKLSVSGLPGSCQTIFHCFFPVGFHMAGSDTSPEQVGSFEIEEAFHAVFSYLIGRFSFVIAIDDMQYCDSASLEFIQKVLSRQFGERVFLLLCCRRYCIEPYVQGLLGTGGMERLVLENFTREEVELILSQQLGREQSRRYGEPVYQESNGNPLYLFEIIQSLKSKKPVENYKFLTLLDEKMKLLSKREQTVLRICSIFFGDIILEAVASIMGLDLIRAIELMEPLVLTGFLRDQPGKEGRCLIFTHERFRKYIYQKQPLAMRKTFHIKVAEYLVDWGKRRNCLMNVVDDIIYHYDHGGQTVKYLEYKLYKAASIVSVNHDYPEFLITLTQSSIHELEEEMNHIPVPVSLKFELVLLQASFAIKTCDYALGVQYADHILQYDTDPRRLLSAHKQLIYYGLQTRNQEIIRSHSICALRLLRGLPNNNLEKAELLKSYALAEINDKHYRIANRVLEQCLTLLNTEPISEAVLYNKACVFNYKAYEYKYRGEYDLCVPLYRKAIEICTSANICNGLPLFYMNLGQAYLRTGQRAAAKECFLEVESINERIHSSLSTAMVKAYLAQIYFQEGDYLRAADYIKEACRFADLIQNAYEDAYLYQIIAMMKDGCEDRPQARAVLDPVLPLTYEEYADRAARLFKKIGLERENMEMTRD